MSKNKKNNGIKKLQKSEEKTIAAIILLYHPIDHMANGSLKNITKVSKFCQFKPHGTLLFRISLYLKMRHRFTVI